MKTADIVIVGGGMVGLALAALLAETECQIKLLEKMPPQPPTDEIATRVSAINDSSQQLLMAVGAWQQISPKRLSPYTQMYVSEKDSFAKVSFDNADPMIKQLGLAQLGFIVENPQIQWALWQQVSQQANVEILYDVPKSLDISNHLALLSLGSGEILTTKLVVGADGANSWVRTQAKMPLISQDYQHTALVCTVKTAEPHQQTARQMFAPESILAFLPLADEHQCSIVWSLPPEQAQQLQQLDEKTFNKALTIAFDHQLGLCELQSSRTIYPLVARYSRDFAQSRVALVGDAAHTIHPLAGLGVNLGFADVATLAQQLKLHLSLGNDIGEYRHLRQFERKRKTEAVKVLAAMQGLKTLFSGDNPAKKWMRGVGLQLVDRSAFIKRFFIEQTLGF